ncbi:MAG: DUF3307 domain-containing protein [Halobacteriovoraceae bacterium]|nr:DUF3307 domain-containing protein [Halobacteriovoraceae bacterium]
MMSKLYLFFVLSIAFHLKHYLCDYVLQSKNMVIKKKSDKWNFFIPLFLHSCVHGIFTLTIVLWIDKDLWFLAIVDMVVHFLMDRIKSGPRYLGRFHNLDTSIYWNILGFDQMIHHLTHLYIIYRLVAPL